MIVGLDHVGLAVADPAAAAEAYGLLFGAPPSWDRRFELANTALKITGGDETVFSLGFAAEELEETRRTLQRRGLDPDGEQLSLVATHGVSLRLVSASAAGGYPEARADAPHALDHVVIATVDPERAVALYGGRLGLDLRLDRANPQWGARQLFFRCGGTVVEIAVDLNGPRGDGPDRITGLAWRVADPQAARARLAAAELNVSEVRKGRKPGTAVFTVRSGLPGGPALLIGPDGDAPAPPHED